MSFHQECEACGMGTVEDPVGVHIRRARPDDAERLATTVAALSGRSLFRRFLHGVSAPVATAELGREVRDREPHGVAFVAEDADGRIVGEAYAAALDDASAEVAFVVSDRWQHHGVGTLLRSALFDRLRADGIGIVYADTLLENRPMLELLRDAGLPLHEERCQDGIVRVRVELGKTLRR
jgi:GNAT superfamily N-acetyltransferase